MKSILLPPWLKFLFIKTILKFVPKLQKRLLLLLKNAKKLNLSERSIIIYIIYHFDYPHLPITYINNTNRMVHNNFTVYPKIKNFKKSISDIKFFINCKGKYNGMEIIKIENKSVISYIKKKIDKYNNPMFRNSNLFSNLFLNSVIITQYYEIPKVTLQNNITINTTTLKNISKASYPKYKKYIIKEIKKDYLYIKIGSFRHPFTENEEKYLNSKVPKIKLFRNKNIILDIRGNRGGSQEGCYPFIGAIFGNGILTFIKQKKQLEAIYIKNGTLEKINQKEKINYNVKNIFTGNLIVLMNYSSASMSIICISWLKFLQKKFNINIKFIGTDIQYQRGLSNIFMTKEYPEYNLKIGCPNRYISKRGIKDINIIFKPDYYYMNEIYLEDNNYPEKNIPIDFILKLNN